MRKILITTCVSVFVVAVVLTVAFFHFHTAYAQTTDPCASDIANETHEQLQAGLDACNAEIAQWTATLNASKQNTASLKNDAAVLTAKINQAKAFIKQKNIEIAQLNNDIADKANTIATLESQINASDASIADLLRKTSQLDQFSLADVILSKQNLSDYFSDADSYGSINKSLQTLLANVRSTQNLTQQQKDALAKQKNQQTDLAQGMLVQQKQVTADEVQKQYLITVNQTKEKSYAQVIADEQAKVAQIKAKLFGLAGGSSAIPFGTALTYAQKAGAATGVDPAFLLAILTQESNLGANVGKCYLTDTTSGMGVSTTGKVWSNLMKPSRDIPPFLNIVSQLGFDPLKTVVSCPIAGAGGYGGAMGPAQFIASTWALLATRIQSAVGHFGNPWNPQDAFMASALYLSDLGANGTSYSANIHAACKYYGTGGSTCSYGRSVMGLDTSIQGDIDYLNEYGVAKQ